MSRVCAICGKGQQTGNLVSHSNRKSRTAWRANVQKVKVVKENGATESMYVGTR